MKENNVIEKGLIEKFENAKKIRLTKLKSIGIENEDELETILHDKKFSIKHRLAKLAEEKGVSLNELDFTELKPIDESIKSKKFKAYESLELQKENKNIRSTNPVYMINRTGRTLYTQSGQPLYHQEVCAKYPGGNKIYMMRSNGTMGYEYLTQSDYSDSNFRAFAQMEIGNWQPSWILRCRGSKVDLHYANGAYMGYIDYEDCVKDRVSGNKYQAGNTNHNLMAITHYWVYGNMVSFDGFVNTKLNVASHMNNLAVYGDPTKL